eukprot:10399281-Lingulodinium_polyedra.AAC.1
METRAHARAPTRACTKTYIYWALPLAAAATPGHHAATATARRPAIARCPACRGPPRQTGRARHFPQRDGQQHIHTRAC